MSKLKVVVNRGVGRGVKILTNPMMPDRFLNDKNAAIDPDMRHLNGVPLEKLIVKNGLVEKSSINSLVSHVAIPLDVLTKRAFKAKRNRLFIDIVIVAVMFYLFKNGEQLFDKMVHFWNK